MKKVYKIFVILLMVLIFIPLLKNTILYFSYNFKPTILVREGENWNGTFDRVYLGYVPRYEINLKNINDSLAILKIKVNEVRIDGKLSEFYSWNALLPFSKENKLMVNDTVRLIKTYAPYMNVNWEKTYLYKISNDSMYISDFFPPEYFEQYDSPEFNAFRRSQLNRFFKELFKPSNNTQHSWGLLEGTEVNSPNVQFSDVVNISVILDEWVKLYKEIIN